MLHTVHIYSNAADSSNKKVYMHAIVCAIFNLVIIWLQIRNHSKCLKCHSIDTICNSICECCFHNDFTLNWQRLRLYKNTLNLHQIRTCVPYGIWNSAHGANSKQIYKFACVRIWSKVCEFEIDIKFTHTFAHMQIQFFVPWWFVSTPQVFCKMNASTCKISYKMYASSFKISYEMYFEIRKPPIIILTPRTSDAGVMVGRDVLERGRFVHPCVDIVLVTLSP